MIVHSNCICIWYKHTSQARTITTQRRYQEPGDAKSSLAQPTNLKSILGWNSATQEKRDGVQQDPDPWALGLAYGTRLFKSKLQ